MITLTDIAGLFERGVLADPVDGDDLIILARLAKTGTDKKSGKFNIAVAKASTIGGQCPPVYKDTEDGYDTKTETIDPCIQVADGANCQQYYKMKVLGSTGEGEAPCPSYTLQVGPLNLNTGKVEAPPAGTYVIIIEYELNNPFLGGVDGVIFPLGVIPTWTNTSGSRDILTVVSDGETARGVATLGYTA